MCKIRPLYPWGKKDRHEVGRSWGELDGQDRNPLFCGVLTLVLRFLVTLLTIKLQPVFYDRCVGY
jgi:hypothetical protein